MIRGVGPVYAKKLVRSFGEKVFDIGPIRAASILSRTAFCSTQAVRSGAVFLPLIRWQNLLDTPYEASRFRSVNLRRSG
jgi:hypothetical protein